MTPYYADDWLTVYHGDSRSVLAEMPADSVHCVVTSPPYWGLRDYGIDSQLGLEATPEEFVANMVAVFREVRRVLRPDGTLWLNLGDSYASSQSSDRRTPDERASSSTLGPDRNGLGGGNSAHRAVSFEPRPREHGLKPKDLVGIPWRVAFALQVDGWYLRSDIIWAKPNPMPESVTDRPTKSHEYLFLLAKSARYFYDADAVREAHDDKAGPVSRFGNVGANGGQTGGFSPARREHADELTRPDFARRPGGREYNPAGRNIRTVWTIATAPYPGAHFATFPPKLVEPCIKAGTSERGVCPECGAPWKRIVEREVDFTSGSGRAGNPPNGKNGSDYEQATSGTYDVRMGPSVRSETTGWRPSCRHVYCPVCHNTGDGNTDGDLSTVRSDVRAEGPSPARDVLLEGMFGTGDGSESPGNAGLRSEREGLHPTLSAGSSDGDADGLRGRASAGDGRDAWADAPTDRSRGSHQRDQGRQPAGEPASHDEAGARQPLEPRASEDGDMPGLRESLPAQGSCGQCGADLRPLTPVPATVLDCFAGSGTTGMVAQSLSRRAVLIDLSMDYLGQLMERNRDIPLGLGA